MKYRLALLASLGISGPALACSCLDAAYEEAAVMKRVRAEAFTGYPIIAEGQLIAAAPPIQCRFAPLGWLFWLSGGRADVPHVVDITRTVRGVAARRITVVQRQQVYGSGCSTGGSAACEPSIRPGRQWWVLRREGQVYRRASMCTHRLVLDTLGLPQAPI